jgi:restriction system protein
MLLASGLVLSNAQIRDELAKKLSLDSEQLSQIHSGSRTEFEYRLAWARTYAKSKGLIQSPTRMHWQITELGKTEWLNRN